MYKVCQASLARPLSLAPPSRSPPFPAHRYPQPLGLYLNNTTHFSRVAGHLGLLDPEDGGTTIPRNVKHYFLNDTESYPKNVNLIFWEF
jgi:hypothetical protein